jgi:putative methyltransferase (TIGR04325 family)
VLDFGGALGHYYQLGKAVLPGVALDFHCREVPLMVEAGRKANPDVHWYADESYQNRTYDLVMINGSLQYIRDWAGVLRQLARLVAGYLLLTRIPIVESGPSFLAVQRIYNTELLHQQFNQGAVLGVMESTGLERVREFVVGDRPYIKNAPEQCELRGWLFKK